MESKLYKVHRGWVLVHWLIAGDYKGGVAIHSVFIEDPAHNRKPQLVDNDASTLWHTTGASDPTPYLQYTFPGAVSVTVTELSIVCDDCKEPEEED